MAQDESTSSGLADAGGTAEDGPTPHDAAADTGRDADTGDGPPVHTHARAHGAGETGGDADRAPVEFWEERYASAEGGRTWSGRVNATLEGVVGGFEPGRMLDLGCGEGGDAIWFAQRGWHATGIDISATAVARAEAAASDAGVAPTRIRFIAADLLDATAPDLWGDERFDLVTASFLHAPPEVELPRIEILRRAAALVAPGGYLFVLSHAAPPPWAPGLPTGHRMPQPAEDLAELALDVTGPVLGDAGSAHGDAGSAYGDAGSAVADAEWAAELVEVRAREATSPEGERSTLDDGVLLLRRRAVS